MTPIEEYEQRKREIAFEDAPEKRIKEWKLILADYGDVLSDSQINGLKLNIELVQRQVEQQKQHEEELEDKINRYIDNVRQVVSINDYIGFLEDMYNSYRFFGTTLADFHIAMRCFNEAGELREALQ